MILIGSKIRELRIKAGLSQEELCGNFMNRTVLSKIENNKALPSIPQLEYISNRFNIPIKYFFPEEDYKCDISQKSFHDFSTIEQMYESGYFHDVIKGIEMIINSYNIHESIILYFYLGMSYFKLNIFRDSQKILKKYIHIYIKADKDIQEKYVLEFSTALNTLFKIMIKNYNYDKGKRYLLLARKYLYKYNKVDSMMSFIIHSNLGYAYNETNQYSDTIYVLESFLKSINNIIYKNIIPDIHISLSIAYYNLEKYSDSIDHIKKSIFFYSYIENGSKALGCYLNYINALRYSCCFEEAFNVLNIALKSAESDIQSYNTFLTQKIILYFNLNKFDELINVINTIKLTKLKKQSRMDLNFILGHIEFINGNFSNSLKHFAKCERYFTIRKYTKDLALLYKDLYIITGDEKYSIKEKECSNKKGRRNILI